MLRFLKEFFCAMSYGHDWQPDLTESPVRARLIGDRYWHDIYNSVCIHCNAVNLAADRIREQTKKREEGKKNAFSLVKRERERKGRNK